MSSRFSLMSRYEHSLDDKGRLALPVKHREELLKSGRPEEVVALPLETGGLVFYPHESWQAIEADLRKIIDSDEREKALDFYMGNAERLSIDKSGRVLIPQRQRLSLLREVEVRGALYKIVVSNRPLDFAVRAASFTNVRLGDINPDIIKGLPL
ncbi:MAG: hypothetical protein AMR96_07070 [Candidatus Adiutrix intracellularis]|nr:MAG: hypothetical protein AMR96_07070 [Candidatus Adiutrix intracellularis]